MEFTWDENKNKANIKKHKIGFNDVIPAFLDEKAISFEDKRYNYSDGQRMILIGKGKNDLLYVVYAELEDGDILRIVSARHAEKPEIKRYRQGF